MKKFLLSGMLVVFLLGTVLMGCSSSNQGSEDEEITITWWVEPRFTNVRGLEEETPNPGDWSRILADQFMEEHPNVTIEIEVLTWQDMPVKVPAAIAAGTPPDILRDASLRTAGYYHQGALENIEELFTEEELDEYVDSFIELARVDGELHSLPSYAWGFTLMYNKNVFENAGVADMMPTNEDPYWTWSEFDEVARTIGESGDVTPYGVLVSTEQGDTGLLLYLAAFGATQFSEDDLSKTHLNSPEGVRALEYLKELNDDGLLQPSAVSAPNGDIFALLFQNKLGMLGASPTIENQIATAKKEGKTIGEHEMVAVAFPDVDGEETAKVAVGPTNFVVFKQDNEYKKEMIKEFLKFLNSDEHQETIVKTISQFSVKKNVAAKKELLESDNLKTIGRLIDERGAIMMGGTLPNFARIRPLLPPEVQAVLLEQKSPEEALADYEKAVGEVLQGNE